MTATIRSANPADAADLAYVNTMGWRDGFAGLLPAEFLAKRSVPIELWQERLVAVPERAGVFAAEVGGVVVGYCMVGPVQPGDGEEGIGQLYAIYLLAEHWGRGIGHALHAAGMSALAAEGFPQAVLWVLRDNERSIAFYLREGWFDDAAVRDDPGDPAGDVVLRIRRMRRNLPRRSARAQPPPDGNDHARA